MAQRITDPVQLFELAVAGDRGALARLLSLIERGGEDARIIARLTYPKSGSGYTVGITGAPIIGV